MRRLKVITTTFVIFGVLLLFGFPFVFAMRPGPSAAQRDRQIFALTITGYFFLICIVLGVLMILAWKLWRKQSEELAEKQMENLKELVEGTLTDHAEKQTPHD